MKWPIRKGCMHCSAKLIKLREKISRTCDKCGLEAREGFQKMSEGKFKEGFQKVTDTLFNGEPKKVEDTKKTIKIGLEKKRKTIEKKLRKKGIDQETIDKELNNFSRLK